MAEDFGNITESDTLASAQPTGDVLAGGDRVQQPGTLIRDPRFFPQELEREQRQVPAPVREMPSTKYAVLQFQVDNTRTYQLLPQDLKRKIAYIKVLQSQANGILIGPDPVLNAGIGGYPISNGDPEKPYTSGSPLFAIGTSSTKVQVNVLVEMFDGVATVN